MNNQSNCISKEYLETEIVADKQLRKNIDEIIQRLKSLDYTQERGISVIKLQEAVMWLGMDLKRINAIYPEGCPDPYPNGKNPSNTKIAPTADGLKL